MFWAEAAEIKKTNRNNGKAILHRILYGFYLYENNK
jgi:hypothetical protein